MLPLSALSFCVAHVIVIDPGHGGYQPGARAGRGRSEKQLTLSIAVQLEAELARRGHTVLLTRNDDRYVSLFGRARFANTKDADVLISLHANDSRNRAASGIETFFLAARATDAEAEALAARENQDDAEGADPQELLENILSDLKRSNAQIESELLAARVQGALIKATGARSRGVKQAPLAVLKKPEMAAILVEVGFLTNPDELARLWSDGYQRSLAGGIAAGLTQFFVDTQSGVVPELPPASEAPVISLKRAPPPVAKKKMVKAREPKPPKKLAKSHHRRNVAVR